MVNEPISSDFVMISDVLEHVFVNIVGSVLLTAGLLSLGQSGITKPLSFVAFCFLVSSIEDNKLPFENDLDPLIFDDEFDIAFDDDSDEK